MKKKPVLSEIVKMLENAFDVLNDKYFESSLSKSVITIQSTPSAYGHFTVDKVWNLSKDSKAYEINLGAETLNRKIENVIATLIHEMVHQYCAENDIKDVSRGGTYHNKKFKAESEKRELIISYSARIGWSLTEPSENLKEFVNGNKAFENISLYRKGGIKKTSKKKSSTRKYICPCCEQTVRATKEVNILCGGCNEKMICSN